MITTICCASTIDHSWLSDADRARVRMKLPITKPFAPAPALPDAAANWASADPGMIYLGSSLPNSMLYGLPPSES
jgi:hypothetical protein